MNKRFWIFVGVGLVAVAMAVAAIVYLQWGAHVELKGSILKVRTLAPDDNSSIAIIDFRFVNPSDYPFIVRTVDVSLEDEQGNIVEGSTISEVDAKRLFQYFPILGQKYNDSLLIRTRVEPRHSMDRMVAARFEIPESRLNARKRLRVRIEDVDGAVSEIVEEPSGS